MEIYVNSQPVEFKLQDEKTFGDVYAGLQDWVSRGEKRIWGIQVNDRSCDIQDLSPVNTMPVSDITVINLSVGDIDPGKEMLHRVESLAAGMQDIRLIVSDIIDKIHTGSISETTAGWRKLLLVVGRFNETLPYLAALHTDREVLDKIEGYKSIMKEILSCMDLSDNVSLCDQLEYEFAPMLDEWGTFLEETRKLISREN